MRTSTSRTSVPTSCTATTGRGFTDVTAEAGVGDAAWGTSSVFFDADGDGDLDLFVANYVKWSADREIECFGGANERTYCHPNRYNGPAPDVLYRNDGDGSFTDISRESGIWRAYGNGLGVVSADFNARAKGSSATRRCWPERPST